MFSQRSKAEQYFMIYLNGSFILDNEAKLEHNDRGLLLSYGIFETMRCYQGKIFALSDHYTRLKKSADYLEIPFSMTLEELSVVTKSLLERNMLEEKDASLRLTLTRGTGPRGILPPDNVKPTLMITAFPFTTHVPKPLKVVTSTIRRNDFSPLSNIKSLCYLDSILARREAAKKGADECILLNTAGNVACASVANIFVVTSKGIITPRLEDGVLPGITRKIVIEICKSNNIPVFEEALSEINLMNAKEVFFTNRLIEIQPVVQINNAFINEGKIGDMVVCLQKLYKDFVVKQLEIENVEISDDLKQL